MAPALFTNYTAIVAELNNDYCNLQKSLQSFYEQQQQEQRNNSISSGSILSHPSTRNLWIAGSVNGNGVDVRSSVSSTLTNSKAASSSSAFAQPITSMINNDNRSCAPPAQQQLQQQRQQQIVKEITDSDVFIQLKTVFMSFLKENQSLR